jgi:SNF2 family DNA or RNA helicase
MGLGKTVQIVATITELNRRRYEEPQQSRRERFGPPGPHIILCPASVVTEWHEQARYIFPDRYTIHLEGDKPLTKSDFPSDDAEALIYHVVIAPYDTWVARHTEKRHNTKKGPWNEADTNFRHFFSRKHSGPYSFLMSKCFSDAWLDEAHELKAGSGGARFSAVQHLNTDYCVCITGTPALNSLDDLRGILELILPQVEEAQLLLRINRPDQFDFFAESLDQAPKTKQMVRLTYPAFCQLRKMKDGE